MQNVRSIELSLETDSFFPFRRHRFMLHSLEKAFREIKNWKHLNRKSRNEKCVCVYQWNSINICSIPFFYPMKMCCDFNWIRETFLLFVAIIAIQKKSEFKRKRNHEKNEIKYLRKNFSSPSIYFSIPLSFLKEILRFFVNARKIDSFINLLVSDLFFAWKKHLTE